MIALITGHAAGSVLTIAVVTVLTVVGVPALLVVHYVAWWAVGKMENGDG